MAAGVAQQAQQVDQAHRPRILVRLRCRGINHQDPALGCLANDALDRRARCRLLRQLFAPGVQELGLVHHLVLLDAAAGIRAAGDAFEMDHRGRRLVDHLQACLADLEGQVGVLVIGRCIAGIEAAQALEQLFFQHDCGTGTIVGGAGVAVGRVGRIAKAPVVPARAIAEHQAAGFLQATVGIDQARTDQAGAVEFRERVQHGFQPAGGDLGIVVEEQQPAAAGRRRAGVAAADEAQVFLVAEQVQAGNGGQGVGAVIGRGIVDNDDFERCRPCVLGQRGQAG